MSTTPQNDHFELVHAPIDAPAIGRFVRGAGDGATVVLDGFVRNESHGRSTSYLEYEAYETMALSKMKEIAAQAHEKFAIHRVAIVHRLGRLEIGETSVFIAVSSAHLVGWRLMPAGLRSTRLRRPCPSGKKNISRMAWCGRRANCRRHHRA